MSKKVICESCGTIFKEEVVKDMNCCPVCGLSFDADIKEDKMEDMQSEEEVEEGEVFCNICGAVFDKNFVKDRKRCPACGAYFRNDTNKAQLKDTIYSLMYFDKIVTSFTEHPEYNGVRIYCSECGEMDSLDLDLFDKFVDEKYVQLKKDMLIKCKGCGREHITKKIFYKRKDHYAPPLPHCPVCGSIMLKKISKTSKFVAAATLGTLSLPYNSKTFECKDCGYRF